MIMIKKIMKKNRDIIINCTKLRAKLDFFGNIQSTDGEYLQNIYICAFKELKAHGQNNRLLSRHENEKIILQKS